MRSHPEAVPPQHSYWLLLRSPTPFKPLPLVVLAKPRPHNTPIACHSLLTLCSANQSAQRLSTLSSEAGFLLQPGRGVATGSTSPAFHPMGERNASGGRD